MQENHQELLNAAQHEILSERALRYKRNVLVLSVVLLFAYAVGAQFSNLNIFGIRLPVGIDDRTAALAVLWIANAYNILMLVTHGFGDWSEWVENLTGRWPDGEDRRQFFYPELRMYWRKFPKHDRTILSRMPNDVGRFRSWNPFEIDRLERLLTLSAQFKNRNPNLRSLYQDERVNMFRVPVVVEKQVQRQIIQLVAYELAPVALTLAAAIIAGIVRIWI
ncbi:MAG: hypothetical protein VX871_12680 [Pseudomonadota bacterium]|nr:hypothetical protein [Pseudomonadota bacterium]